MSNKAKSIFCALALGLSAVAIGAETSSQRDSDKGLNANVREYATTADLVVADAFLIRGEYEVSVNYQPAQNQNVYLSVCTDFIRYKDRIDLNYQSCVLRTSTAGQYQGKLTMANDKRQLVMAIWYLDDVNHPRYAFWEYDENDTAQSFDVN